jgi:hypothetical protein
VNEIGSVFFDDDAENHTDWIAVVGISFTTTLRIRSPFLVAPRQHLRGNGRRSTLSLRTLDRKGQKYESEEKDRKTRFERRSQGRNHAEDKIAKRFYTIRFGLICRKKE